MKEEDRRSVREEDRVAARARAGGCDGWVQTQNGQRTMLGWGWARACTGLLSRKVWSLCLGRSLPPHVPGGVGGKPTHMAFLGLRAQLLQLQRSEALDLQNSSLGCPHTPSSHTTSPLTGSFSGSVSFLRGAPNFTW